jgi:hypothetical protein
MKRLAQHLSKGTPLIATGEEAIKELEICNAAYLSGFNGAKPVDVPVDAQAMERLLNKLIRTRATGRGGDLRKKAARKMKQINTGSAKKTRRKR